MVMELEPPARTSRAAADVVQGSGANHCFRSSTSVQQRKIFSRGASMMRVSESSWRWVCPVMLQFLSPA
jgi:hypothetical protein